MPVGNTKSEWESMSSSLQIQLLALERLQFNSSPNIGGIVIRYINVFLETHSQQRSDPLSHELQYARAVYRNAHSTENESLCANTFAEHLITLHHIEM